MAARARKSPNENLERFFDRQNEALTFDDVRVEVGYANFFPNEVELRSRISRNVFVGVPIIGAAMDTVCESPMAIELAKAGGLGMLHRALDPQAQAAEVDRVKYHIHGLINEPVTTGPFETVAELDSRRKLKGYAFDSFPVVDGDKKLLGLITHHDFKRCDDSNLPVTAWMTQRENLVVAEPDISLQEAYRKLKECKKNVLPLVNKDDQIVGMYLFTDLKRILGEKKTEHNVDSQGRLRVGAAVGTGEEAMERAKLLAACNVDVFHIDTAHGLSKGVIDTVRALKEAYPTIDVTAGNVSNAKGALALAHAGADGIFVGQGGGSICTTRRVMGIGKPQVSAIFECAYALWKAGFDIPVCGDGGIRESGDIVVALAAGADTVMVGNILAGTEEAPGEVFTHTDNRLYKSYRGMGSLAAMQDSGAARQRYLHTSGAFIPEGVEGMVPYKGPVSRILEQLVGGIRKGLWYTGSRTIPNLQREAEFIRGTPAGLAEGHPHDVQMQRLPPNYSGRNS